MKKSHEGCKHSYRTDQYCSHIPDNIKLRMYNMEVNDILKKRGSRYGGLIDNAKVSQSLKSIFRLSKNWNNLPEDMQEALDNIALKTGRILTGDFNYDDNWKDIAGYAELVNKRLDKESVDGESGVGSMEVKQELQVNMARERVSLSDRWRTLFGNKNRKG